MNPPDVVTTALSPALLFSNRLQQVRPALPGWARPMAYGTLAMGDDTGNTPGQAMNANHAYPAWGSGLQAERGSPVRLVGVRRFGTESAVIWRLTFIHDT